MKIAYISCHDYAQYSVGYIDEESALLEFLRKKGLDIGRCVWNDESTDWKQYDVAILKSPWDYHEQIEAFHAWLNLLQELDVRLLNPLETVRWNSDKHYLADIAAGGLKVIPSIFLEKNSTPDLSQLFAQLQTEKIVIKPCVSAGAKNTFSLTPGEITSKQEEVYRLLGHESYCVQPFMHEIHNGEWTLMFFNGKYSHCVLKRPGEGDFRVQHYYGGNVQAAEPRPEYISSATEYVQQFAKGALYTRVDGIICDGEYHLMELELIEPFLYLDTDAGACERYYKALVELTGM